MNDGEWCTGYDVVEKLKYYRCSICGRRLFPKEREYDCGFLHLMLPFHKKKGYKITRLKKRQHKIIKEKKNRMKGTMRGK